MDNSCKLYREKLRNSDSEPFGLKPVKSDVYILVYIMDTEVIKYSDWWLLCQWSLEYTNCTPSRLVWSGFIVY